jgi:hypothetical protein
VPGQAVTLTWSASGQAFTIYRLNAQHQLADFVTVGPSGSVALGTPLEQRNYVDFVLYATAGGATVQSVVTAAILCPDSWFFAPGPGGCPASAPHFTAMQAQHFQHGQMLWTQYNDRITVLFSDATQPAWDTLSNAWFSGQPESDPSLIPPPGYYQPVRGFGVAWRTGYVSPSQVLRDRLGWATDQEFSVPGAAFQCDSAPKYNRCFISAPGGLVYLLLPERSGWQVWPSP